MALKFSIDGGVTFQEAPEGVRLIVEDVIVPGEDGCGELHLNATQEGLIIDVWATRDTPLDHNIGTSSEMYDDVIDRLVVESE